MPARTIPAKPKITEAERALSELRNDRKMAEILAGRAAANAPDHVKVHLIINGDTICGTSQRLGGYATRRAFNMLPEDARCKRCAATLRLMEDAAA